MAKLKVFRTAIGFHDAYVAAPSKKAALKAWGTNKDLFARGAAEIVTDPALTREPLANPGEVFKLSRGSAAEQMAALSRDKPVARQAKTPAMRKVEKPAAPRPDRAALDKAESALKDADARHRDAVRDVNAEIARMEKQRQKLESANQRDIAKLEKARAAEEARYRHAMEKWRDG